MRGIRDREQRSVDATVAIYRAADAAAIDARHESLSMSIRIDAARFMRSVGRVGDAAHVFDRVIDAARAQGNHRRGCMALMERARLYAEQGWRAAAWHDLARATALYDWLQLDRRGKPAEEDWYQPGLRRALAEVEAQLEAVVGPRPEDGGRWPELVPAGDGKVLKF